MLGWLSHHESIEVPCTIDVEHTNESLHAHVDLDGDLEIGPGDEVLVHGEAIDVPFGERRVFHRRATVRRASWFKRQWTRFAAQFELTELYEVSFTSGRKL